MLRLLCYFGRIALENLQQEHQRALEHVVESKDKELDAVAHAKDHARSLLNQIILLRSTVTFLPMCCTSNIFYDTVHSSTDLSLWLDSPMFWAP